MIEGSILSARQTDPRSRWRAPRTMTRTVVRVVLFVLSAATNGAAQVRDSTLALIARADSLSLTSSATSIRESIQLYRRAEAGLARNGSEPQRLTLDASMARAFRAIGEPDSAVTYLTRAVIRARALGDTARLVLASASLSRVFMDVSLPDSAVARSREALLASASQQDSSLELVALGTHGMAFESRRQFDSALVYLHRARRSAERSDPRSSLPGILNSLANVYQSQGLLDSSLVYQRALLARDQRANDVSGQAITLHNLGLTFERAGRMDSSLLYYRRSLVLKERGTNRRTIGLTLSNMAYTFGQTGQFDSSLAAGRRALAIGNETADRARVAAASGELGSTFRKLGFADSALFYHRVALGIWQSQRNAFRAGGALNNIGNVFLDRDEVDSARSAYRLALEQRRAADDKRGQGITLLNMGKAENQGLRHDSAVTFLRAAIALIKATGNTGSEGMAYINLGSSFASLGRADSAMTYHALALSAARSSRDFLTVQRVFENLGTIAMEGGDRRRALAMYDSSAAVVRRLATWAGSDINRATLAEQTNALFDRWTLAAAGGQSEVSTAALTSLAVSERGRAQALSMLMRKVADTADAATDLGTEGRGLAATIRRGSAAVIYLPTTDTLLTWVVDPRGVVHLFRAPIRRTQIDDAVQQYRVALGVDGAAELTLRGQPAMSPDPSLAGTQSRRRIPERALAAIVLPSAISRLLRGARAVLVIPSGSLAMVPFASIPAIEGDAPLGIAMAVRYAPSLTVARLASERRIGLPDAGALVVGNPEMPRIDPIASARGGLAALPAAEEESRRVARQLGVTPLVGGAATETTVRRRLGSATVVHLATHGFAYSGQPLQSFVALATDSLNDGRFTVGEIVEDESIRFVADLVVLSACQTGLGSIRLAEGTIGLQRAILARGARTVLVSLWSVSDRATLFLMDEFYRQWRAVDGGITKAEALRRAQASVRAMPGFSHPRYWAGFQLVGAP